MRQYKNIKTITEKDIKFPKQIELYNEFRERMLKQIRGNYRLPRKLIPKYIVYLDICTRYTEII